MRDWILCIGSLCLIVACSSGEGDPEPVDYPVRCATEGACFTWPYQLVGPEASSSQRNMLPVPYDFFTTEDPDSPTGRRLSLAQPESLSQPGPNARLLDRGVAILDAEVYTEALNRLDGFGAFASILIETGEPLDPALFDGDGTEADAPIFVVDLDPDSPRFGERLPYRAQVRVACQEANVDEADCEKAFDYLILRPDAPLTPGGRAGVFVTIRARSASGLAPLMSNHFQEVWSVLEVQEGRKGAELRMQERRRLAALRQEVEAIEFLDMSEIVLAFDFTLAASTRALDAISSQWLPQSAPPALDLDPDGDGVDNIYAPADYPDHLPPLPEVDLSQVAALVAGTLALPDFRHDRDEASEGTADYHAFQLDPAGVPQPADFVPREFFLFYPVSGLGPMPVVLLQHGINSKKEDVAPLVPVLAAQGVASFMMDFPFHGSREQGFAPMEYLDLFYPSKAATSVPQSVAEHLVVLKALAGARFDLWPLDAADGEGDFDPERIAYFGNSLGSNVGSISVGLSPDVDLAVLAVGGGGMQDYVDPFLAEYGLDQVYPGWYTESIKLVIQCFLDAGDGVHFAPRMRARREAGQLQVLAMEAMEDETIPAPFSRNLSKAARYTQIEPVAFAIDGLESAAAPYRGDAGLVQIPGAHHNMVFEAESPGPENRAMIEHFFLSGFSGGTAEIQWQDLP